MFSTGGMRFHVEAMQEYGTFYRRERSWRSFRTTCRGRPRRRTPVFGLDRTWPVRSTRPPKADRKRGRVPHALLAKGGLDNSSRRHDTRPGRFDITISQRPRGRSIEVLPPRLYPGSSRPELSAPTAAVGVYVASRHKGWQAGVAMKSRRVRLFTWSDRRLRRNRLGEQKRPCRAFRSNLSGGLEARFERRAYDEQ